MQKSVPKRLLYDTMVAAMKKRQAAIESVALYARVSTRDKGQDTENQLIALREFAHKQGWQIAAEYVDHDSGGKPNRPRFQAMFRDAAQRKFDLVLFWSLDRFSREGVHETLDHLRRLTDAGVEWKSLQEQYLDSVGIFREAVLSILATLAKQERVRRSERATAAINRLKRQGRTDHLGRPRLVLNRERVREMSAGGLSCRQIAEAMQVSPMTISRIIRAEEAEA